LCLLGLLLGIIWLFQIHSLLWIFIAGSFFYFFYSAINPLSDNLSKRTADQRKIEFGSIRSWNSFGFAFISLISGFYFSKFGMGHFSIPMIVIALLALVLSFYINDVD